MDVITVIDLRKRLDAIVRGVGDGQPILLSKHGSNVCGVVPVKWAELIELALLFDRGASLVPEQKWKEILEDQLRRVLDSGQPSLALVIEKLIEASDVLRRYHEIRQ